MAARTVRPIAALLTGLALTALLVLTGCETASLPVDAGTGPEPVLPEPRPAFIPTVKVAPTVGWPADTMPTPAEGLEVSAYERNLVHPRWLYTLPNGDVLVAESDVPPREDARKGVRAWFMKLFMKRAGSGGPSANRITLLRDADGDGVVDVRTVFLENLNSPFGMALMGHDLYVANTDALWRFPYRRGVPRITSPGHKVVDLPHEPLNHHWTKNVIAHPDGKRLYVTVGSNSNVAEHGMEVEVNRAAILEVRPDAPPEERMRVYASGLRNPNGLAFEPHSGALWTTVNERDEIGSDLVPDYMTSVQEGGFYGWPYSYFGQHVDVRAQPPRPDLVAKAIVPDYALGPHTASFGLVFHEGADWPERFRNGAFIGQHGSWNRRPPSGYKVIFVPFSAGKPSGPPVDVLTGFLDAEGNARGRPVGLTFDRTGALLVADDAGNTVWRVAPKPLISAAAPLTKRRLVQEDLKGRK